MLTFFRRIRKGLIDSSSARKYVLYAIGEIALVVFGILIALQINNWNEERKHRIDEVSLLRVLKSNFETSLEELKADTVMNRITVTKYQELIKAVKEDLPYDESLGEALVLMYDWASPHIPNTAYESLKSRGIEIIRNIELRNQIVDIYEKQFAYLVNGYDRAEWAFFQSALIPFATKNIEVIDDNTTYSGIPNDFQALKENPEFVNILSKLISLRLWGIDNYTSTMNKVEDVIELIDNELEKEF